MIRTALGCNQVRILPCVNKVNKCDEIIVSVKDGNESEEAVKYANESTGNRGMTNWFAQI